MDKHYGHIVEHYVRKNGYSISELAIQIKINRRSIYNWFQKKHLKSDVVFRIGRVINHDFSKEFPEMFADNEFQGTSNISKSYQNEIWKHKYITLLEKYNQLLEIKGKVIIRNSANIMIGTMVFSLF
ncbi:MAG: hypothetical protein JWQ06_2563 [Mucilaginibacter sp.]|nr:hypothetical protein [Mucilaginibacter sp.]